MKRRANALISIIIAYALAIIFTFFSISGPVYGNSNFEKPLLPETEAGGSRDETTEEAAGSTALQISDSGETSSWAVRDGISFLLSSMRIGYNSIDMEKDSLPDLSRYSSLIINISDLSRLDSVFDTIRSFADQGGSLLFIRPPHILRSFAPWQDLLGIKQVASESASIDTIRPNRSFMIGGGQNYRVNSNYDIAMKATLYGDTDILATTADADIPIIWQRKEKDGRIVVLNFPDYGKQVRGIYMTWVDETAPDIRNVTASGLSGAVQHFSKAIPVLTDQGDSIDIRIANFVDTAYVFLRINNGREPAKVEGGKLTKLTDSLYLLECSRKNMSISFK